MSTAPTTTDVPPPMTFAELVRDVRSDFDRCFAALLGFEALFKLLVGFVLIPSLAALLFALVRWSGRTALANEDVLSFILSPWGVLYAFLLGIKGLGVSLLEHAGVTDVVALKRSGHWRGFRHAMTMLAARTLLVLRLTALILGIAVLGLAPFAALAALTYTLLLGQQDINYYLADRPPAFYAACTIGAVLLLGALALAAYLYVRWVFALCIVLLENQTPLPALKVSAERTRGIRWRIALVLLGWQAIGVVVQLLVLGVFRLLAGLSLDAAGLSPRAALPLVVLLLGLHGLVAAAVSAFVVVIHCLLILRMYVHRGLRLGILEADTWGDALDVEPARSRRLLRQLEWGVGAVALAGALTLLVLTTSVNLEEKVEVQAHRGYSEVAPENTLAAIQKAIDVGADWAEFDVQESADGEVVLMHDRDLRRVIGNKQRIRDVLLSDLKRFRFKPEYARDFPDERIPTLREVLTLCQDQDIKLNIELKPYGKPEPLAKKVVDLIDEYDFEERCLVASLDYPALVATRKHNSRLKLAYIVSPLNVGNLANQDVDFLEIHKDLAKDNLLRRAHRQGKKVFVWTVDDRREMQRYLDRGVDSIITNNPALLMEVRKERDELGDTQKLLLACRHLLK
jgi:glycerophosphoryl diester phosphodiesterase